METIAVVVLGVLAFAGIVWYRNRDNKAGRTDGTAEPPRSDDSIGN